MNLFIEVENKLRNIKNIKANMNFFKSFLK